MVTQQNVQQIQYASLPMSTAQYEMHAASICQEAIIVAPEIEPLPIETAMASPNDSTALAECNYKNCTIIRPISSSAVQACNSNNNKPNRTDDMIFRTPQHSRVRRIAHERHASREQLDVVEPPPLFDEKPAEIVDTPAGFSRGSGLSRRNHRTIPRHFTTAEPLITTATVEANPSNAPMASEQPKTATNGANKKPTCQCPVQHVPMTYMGATHLNSTRNQSSELFLSTLNRKHSGNSKSLVAKSTSFPTEAGDVAQSAVSRMFPRDTASGLINDTASSCYQQSSSSTLRRQKTPVKIPTISKQIGNAEGLIQHQQGDVRRRHGSNQMAAPLSLIADPIKTSEHTAKEIKTSPVNIISKNEIVTTPFPIQLIESMGKSNTAPELMQKNPILPPKMSKINHAFPQQHQQPQPQQPILQHYPMQSSGHGYATARIQTISKAAAEANYMIPSASGRSSKSQANHRNHNHHQQDVPSRSSRSKSLPRNDDKYYSPTSTSMATVTHLSAIDKSNSSGKLNFTTNFPILTNHYTLPKSMSSKTSLNSTITDVVSKVPSIINIPSPYAGHKKLLSPNGQKTPDHDSGVIINSTSHSSNDRIMQNILQHNAQQPQQPQKHHRRPPIMIAKLDEKAMPLPVCTTYKNCSNPKEHFLPNDTSLDDDYLSECENCKSAHGSRYYLDEPIEEQPQETMTLQRKMDDKEEEQQSYYRTSSTLPTNTKQKTT